MNNIKRYLIIDSNKEIIDYLNTNSYNHSSNTRNTGEDFFFTTADLSDEDLLVLKLKFPEHEFFCE